MKKTLKSVKYGNDPNQNWPVHKRYRWEWREDSIWNRQRCSNVDFDSSQLVYWHQAQKFWALVKSFSISWDFMRRTTHWKNRSSLHKVISITQASQIWSSSNSTELVLDIFDVQTIWFRSQILTTCFHSWPLPFDSARPPVQRKNPLPPELTPEANLKLLKRKIYNSSHLLEFVLLCVTLRRL